MFWVAQCYCNPYYPFMVIKEKANAIKTGEGKTMMLLTKADREALPELYATENDRANGIETKAVVKFFAGSWTWYAVEFDGTDIFFGYVDGDYPELGYFSLSEFERVNAKGGIQVERDRYFQPTSLKAVGSKIHQ
jgi:hypothetical protein